MIQHQIPITGTLAPCVNCKGQPKHIHVRGSNRHFLECAPCQVRTAKFTSLQEAVEAWEAQDLARFQTRAA